MYHLQEIYQLQENPAPSSQYPEGYNIYCIPFGYPLFWDDNDGSGKVCYINIIMTLPSNLPSKQIAGLQYMINALYRLFGESRGKYKILCLKKAVYLKIVRFFPEAYIFNRDNFPAEWIKISMAISLLELDVRAYGRH